MIYCKKASLEDLETLWDREIAENPDDPRYLRWKERFLSCNRSGRAATFLALSDGSAVGQVTLDRYADGYSGNRAPLADGISTAYINSLRIDPEWVGQGHATALIHTLECWAKSQGYSRLTIGVEADAERTRAIYQHWGYDQFVMAEEDDGELVLFYAKKL